MSLMLSLPDRRSRTRGISLVASVALWMVLGATGAAAERIDPTKVASPAIDAEVLARQVTIHRDQYGVPHIFGENDESVTFGFGYAQAEDYFWQVEDVYILALGRYAEVHGPRGLNSDLLNRAFEIVPRSRLDFAALDNTSQRLYAAFVAGINHYLDTHPEVEPRMIERFEPWHVLAYCRHVALEMTFRFTGIDTSFLPRRNPQIWTATGSNGWAISGERTASTGPMLLANPHMPWFGFAQLMEAHLHSAGGKEGRPWNFIGAGFYGSPTLAMGHNDRLGWTLVTNQPDIADTWQVRFTDPNNPLAYEYDGGWRNAVAWKETIHVNKSRGMETRTFEFRKTHHGPIVAEEGESTLVAARISGLFETIPMRQSAADDQVAQPGRVSRSVGDDANPVYEHDLRRLRRKYPICLHESGATAEFELRLVSERRWQRSGKRMARVSFARRIAAVIESEIGFRAELQFIATNDH